ncbi:MAG: NAD(P)/FAD-dependent oxidoreductase [Lachnospiraceae bacterium]|nr:NAD(P)/FAD-dependent oxidoreductase [Lachnospiraceae bacterium]
MKKVVIIGAGPAGVTAAYELEKANSGMEVIILEESHAIGGISRTVLYNGNRMDIGGHRFFSKDKSVNDWWENVMPKQGSPTYDDIVLGRTMPLKEGGPDPEKVDRVMLRRNRVSRIYYGKKFFDYPIKMNVQTIKNMGFATTMVAGFSYLKSIFVKKKEDCLENFYINRFGKKLYSMFFEGYTEKLWGRHPRDIAADWGAQRVKGLSIIAIFKDNFRKLFKIGDASKVETSLIEEFDYPKLGPGQLWECACKDACDMGAKLIYGAKVTNVTLDGNKAVSVTYENENNEKVVIECDYVISSMPIKDLVAGMNDVPANVREVAGGLPYRDYVTIGLLLPSINLKNETKLKTLSNIVPDCWIYVQDSGVKLGRIQIYNNWSPYMVKKPEETVWIGLEYFCKEGDEFWNMTEDEWVKFGTEELIKMGVINSADEVLDHHRENVKKAYPAYFDTYDRIDEVTSYLSTIENLYCVGRNGQHRYNNMDHSMVTSFESVKNILNGVTDKTNVWNVNTEKVYHEEKGEN